MAKFINTIAKVKCTGEKVTLLETKCVGNVKIALCDFADGTRDYLPANSLEIITDDETMNKCEVCGAEAIETFRGKRLCADCLKELRKRILEDVFEMDIFAGI